MNAPRSSPAAGRRWIGPLLMAMALIAFALASRAYVLEPSRWPSNTQIVLNLGMGSPSAALIDGRTSWDQVMLDAMAVWNPQLGSGVQLTGQIVSTGPVQSDGRNQVAFASTFYGQSFGTGTLAITGTRYTGTRTVETDVLFNSARTWNSYRGALRGATLDIRRVAIHEFGHVLGLDHPDSIGGQSVTAVMNANISNVDTIQADDIAGVQSIYGLPGAVTPTPTPTPTRTPTPTPTFVGPTPTPTPTPPGGVQTGRLINLSTRLYVSSGDGTGIGGFVVGGTATKRFAIRALGPSLALSGVSGSMPDPVLRVVNSTGQTVAQNDDWQDDDAANADAVRAVGLAPSDRRESVLVLTLAPGNYTALVTPYTSATNPAVPGIALVEVYELDGAGTARAVNVSTRGFVGTNDQVMIAGVVIADGQRRIVTRALGPSLAAAGVSGVLANPTLEVVNSRGVRVAFSDDWSGEASATELRTRGLAPTSSSEAATAVTLPAGGYTILVRGAGGAVGNALVEVYEVN